MKKLNRATINTCLVIGIILIGLSSACIMQSQTADYVFTNGKIYTVDENQEWAEAVAVKGENIVYVGSNEGAKAFIGQATNMTDLQGKVMLPGLISAHEHPILFMGSQRVGSWRTQETATSCLKALRNT